MSQEPDWGRENALTPEQEAAWRDRHGVRLLVLVGLPASGKSTWAKDLVMQGYTRVNRDSLRAMLHGGKYSPANEILVKHVELRIVETFLHAGRSVVVDDTNLYPGIVDEWRALAANAGVACEVQRFEVPLEECIRRDALREQPVGEVAIRRLWKDRAPSPGAER